MASCSLLPGLEGILMQFALFVTVVLSLVLKKKLEDRQQCIASRRTWWAFGLDCSKQLAGAGWLHVTNLICSVLLGDYEVMGACEWYWTNIVIDDTLGIYVSYLYLKCITRLLEQLLGDAAAGFRSGSYRDANTGSFQLVRHPLRRIAMFTLGPVLKRPTAELIVVMIVTPCLMNALQCWVVDSFIKDKGEPRDASARSCGAMAAPRNYSDLGAHLESGESAGSSLQPMPARQQEPEAPLPMSATWPPAATRPSAASRPPAAAP